MKEPAEGNNPRFSIVIPTYNTTVVLRQCIEALSNQTVDKRFFEVIVVNDGGKAEVSGDIDSADDSLDITYLSQNHKGPAAARNLGIEKAKGEIILLLDDDSLPTDNWLDATIRAWDASPDFDGIGGYVISEPTDSIYCRVNADFFNWYLEQYSSEDSSSFLVTCNAGYRKDALDRIGRFDDRFKKASGEDRDLNIKILKCGGKMRLDRNILVYHDRDLTFTSFVRKNYNYGKAAYHIYAKYPEQKYLSSTSYVNFYVSIIKKYRNLKEKFMAFSLITLSQAATAVGYYTALIKKENQTALRPQSSN